MNNVMYTEIGNLSQYDRSWIIRGRIIKKSILKTFNSKGKEGCLFNIVIVDDTREI